MKEKLTLRNILICAAAFIAVVCFCLSFAVCARSALFNSGHSMTTIMKGAVWHPTAVLRYSDGAYTDTRVVNNPSIFALPLVGFILVLLAGIGAVVTALVVKDKKVSKIVLVACGLLAVTGGVFEFFVGQTYIRTSASDSGMTIEQAKQMIAALGIKITTGPLGIVTGILSILAGLMVAVSPFLPEKKLAQSK